MALMKFDKIYFPVTGIENIRIPKVVRVHQEFDPQKIDDVVGHLARELDELQIDKEALRGKSIAISVGSRGIPHNKEMVKTIVDKLKSWGAEPFIVAGMGSHGGGTVEGQREILTGYGMTEEYLGVPIKVGNEVVKIGELPDKGNTPVYCDKFAAEADGIVLYNKVKPHTNFHGPHESGLLKMCAIGLAKHIGCSWFHGQGFETFAERIPMVGEVFMKNLNIVFGVGMVQNAYDVICALKAFPPEKIVEGDRELLKIARTRMARFLFKQCDVLVVDRIGKNISGAGADPNVTGRSRDPSFAEVFNAQQMIIRGLTEVSHHNGTGLVLADITTTRCVNDIDFGATWTNMCTTMNPRAGSIPPWRNGDEDAIKLGIRMCKFIDWDHPKIVRIHTTLDLCDFEVSVDMAEALKDVPGITITSEPYDWTFDEEGYMEDFHVEE